MHNTKISGARLDQITDLLPATKAQNKTLLIINYIYNII